jgi:thiol-disulfide isomerase/thioredoxin
MPVIHEFAPRGRASLPRPGMLRVARPIAACMVLGAGLALASGASSAVAAGRQLTSTEVQEFNAASGDPARAEWAISRIRSYLATGPDSGYALFARRMLIRALNTTNATADRIAASAETTAAMLPHEPRVTIFFYGEVAEILLRRGGAYPRALEYARRSLADVPQGQQYEPLLAAALGTLGEAQFRAGLIDSGLATLRRALPQSPDSQAVLFHMGQILEQQKKPDLAIDHYVRSLGVYMATDTSAAAPLRSLWRKRHGSLAGLDARVAASRAASRRLIAFDAHRDERPAPGWTLPDLDGRSVQLADFKGKVVVIDFWGSWCGPCRRELPIFQSMYERYKDKGVVFIGMNWERPVAGKQLKDVAREFVVQNKFTFPVILDHDHIATDAYHIEGFPTLFLIDKTGTIRYKNVGVSDGIETIFKDQLESLLD